MWITELTGKSSALWVSQAARIKTRGDFFVFFDLNASIDETERVLMCRRERMLRQQTEGPKL